ncbi:hypothetical protein LMIY3S_01829 [Labrys miyagiensis]
MSVVFCIKIAVMIVWPVSERRSRRIRQISFFDCGSVWHSFTHSGWEFDKAGLVDPVSEGTSAAGSAAEAAGAAGAGFGAGLAGAGAFGFVVAAGLAGLS